MGHPFVEDFLSVPLASGRYHRPRVVSTSRGPLLPPRGDSRGFDEEGLRLREVSPGERMEA